MMDWMFHWLRWRLDGEEAKTASREDFFAKKIFSIVIKNYLLESILEAFSRILRD